MNQSKLGWSAGGGEAARLTSTRTGRFVIAVALSFALGSPAIAQEDLLPPWGPLTASSGGASASAGGTITAGTAPFAAFYSAPTVLSSTSALQFQATEVVVNETGSAVMDFRVETDNEASALFVDASADDVIFNDGGTSTFNLRVETDNEASALFVDASADDIIFNDGGTSTFNFRVEGDVNAGLFGIDAGTEAVSIVRASGSGTVLTITGGALPTGLGKAVNVTGTLNVGAATQIGNWFDITSSTGGGNILQVGTYFTLNAGYVGSNISVTMQADNSAAGTGINPITTFFGNYGGWYSAVATTVGSNIGVLGKAINSSTNNWGVLGTATAASAGVNIGVVGSAKLGATNIAGYFSLGGIEPVVTNSAIIVDNDAAAAPIALFRDNGTAVFTIADGGGVTGTATYTFSGVTTDVTAGAGEDLRLQGGTATGSVQLMSLDNVIDILDGGGTARGSITTSTGNNRMTMGQSANITSWGLLAGTKIGNTGAIAATTLVGGISDTISIAGNTAVDLWGVYGSGAVKYTLEQTATCASNVLTLDPQSSQITIDGNAANCVVTLSETSAATIGPGFVAVITLTNVGGVTGVTFPDAANVSDVPVLCSATGLTTNNSNLTLIYANRADDLWVGTGCNLN